MWASGGLVGVWARGSAVDLLVGGLLSLAAVVGAVELVGGGGCVGW